MIVLLAFGKASYGFAAYNLAVSLKGFNHKTPIALFYEKSTIGQLGDLSVFDTLIELENEQVYHKGVLDPAKVKVHIYDLIEGLPGNDFLYLDVDALAFKDIMPLFDDLKKKKGYYLTDVVGQGGKGNEKINYAIWAKNEYIWDWFGLKDAAIYPAIQSSYAYIKKSKQAERFFSKVKDYYFKEFPVKRQLMRWGGTVADELLFSGTCAKMGLIPDSGVRPIFFGWKYDPRSPTDLARDYYILAIYGNGKGKTLTKKRYWDLYDRLGAQYAKKMGRPFFKSLHIKKNKHANG